MASIAILKKQVKTLNDFTKVVNIQKIVVMKEISQWQNVIDESRVISHVFSELVYKLNKSYKVLSEDYFDSNKSKKAIKKIPINRDLHFLVEGNVVDNITEYELKVVAEHCEKNNKPDDVYVIIGENLGKYMIKKGFNVFNTMKSSDLNNSMIYSRVAHQILVAYDDLIYNKATFGFLDTTMKAFNSDVIFPIQKDEIKNLPKNMEEYDKILNIKPSKVKWVKDYDSVANSLIKTSIESLIYKRIVEYLLAIKRRELQSLDDKEKNILEEINLVNLKIQRVRKDAVTNELLTNATAFQALSEKDDE